MRERDDGSAWRAQRAAGRVAMVAAAAVLLAARGAHAQDLHAEEHLLDSLRSALDRATVVVRGQQAAERQAETFDTVRQGAVVILTDSASLPLAETIAVAAERRLTPLIGDAAARLARHPFVLRAIAGTGSFKISVAIRDSAGREGLSSRHTAEVAPIVDAMVAKAAQALADDAGTTLSTWLQGPIPLAEYDEVTWVGVRLEMVAAPTRVIRDCIGGDGARCLVALELTPVTDRVTAWYDSTDWRRIVTSLAIGFNRRDPAGFATCRDRSIAICESLLRTVASDELPDALSARVRRSVVREALTLGGTSSYARLIATQGSPAERIAAAAGEPMDAVLDAWHRRVMEAHVAPQSASGVTLAWALLWSCVCGSLALRSSRWR